MLQGIKASKMQLLEMREAVREHIAGSELEVVVVVEAIEPHTSGTFQARHSYTADDIVFDKSFVTCMNVAKDGQAHLNWKLFHKMKDCAFNTAQIIGGSHS